MRCIAREIWRGRERVRKRTPTLPRQACATGRTAGVGRFCQAHRCIRSAVPGRSAGARSLGTLCPACRGSVASSGLAWLGTAPGFAVSPRPSAARFKGVCTRLNGFPVPRRFTHRRAPPPSGLKKIPPGTSKPGAILALQERRRDPAELGRRVKSRAVDEIGARRARQSTAHGQRGSGVSPVCSWR